ncbi:MAG TPA: hypothetical protein PKD79_02475 [Candidatus Doudnabacteria bacterium]|nr:hypothetical protein [Candidatus Doudnabacteria bacterium]
MGFKSTIVAFVATLVIAPSLVMAHQPFLEPYRDADWNNSGLFIESIQIPDPTQASQAIYGQLSTLGEIDWYVFVPEQSGEVRLEILVPIRPRNLNFNPELLIVAREIPEELAIDASTLNLELPDGYLVAKLHNTKSDGLFYEPYSTERYWRSSVIDLPVEAKQNYFLGVVEPQSQIGDYSLGVGTAEDFSNASKIGLLGTVAKIKLGIFEHTAIPWLEIIGLFLFLAGLVIGLGAVTVIDVHGFLGRHSAYWTESTIRAHKVTKPLIWLGLLLLLIGAVITYWESWLTGVALYQAMLVGVLIINGLFLTFYVSPRLLQQENNGQIDRPLSISMRNKIALSFGISFLGWWGTLFLFVWYIVFMR